MVKVELFAFFLLMWVGNANMFHHNAHQIMTPANGQTGNPLPSQGNINENAMFPPSIISNSLASDSVLTNNEENINTTPISPSTNAITSTDTHVQPTSPSPTPPTIVETVTSVGGTVIRLEFPSSINIFVNITNSGQPTTGLSNVDGTVEIATMHGTVDISTVDSATTELSVVSDTVDISTETDADEESSSDRSVDITTTASTSEVTTEISSSIIPVESSTVEISTVEVTDGRSPAIDNTTLEVTVSEIPVEIQTVDNPLEISTDDTTMETSTDSIVAMSTTYSTVDIPITASTVEMATVGNNTLDMSTEESTVVVSTAEIVVDISTVESTVGISTEENTAEIPTTESVSEMPTVEIAVEIIAENNTEAENNYITTVSESSTDTMTHIQININLSDNTQNINFGSTTQPTTGNLQMENKMIYREKCEEYYRRSRAVRKATVQVFIVGGTNSMPKEFPHMAALGYGNGSKIEWLCGGSLISENYIITAAHCVSSKSLGDVQVVRLGTTLLNTETLDSEDYKVIRKIPHPAYNNEEQYNDIALLQLDHTVTFSEYISPICLFSSNVTGEVLIATGWGKTEATGDVSHELQKVELEYFPNKECQDSYSVVSKQDLPRGIEENTQICAGSRSEEKDTCQGDSGGPLQIQDDGKMYIVGITSFGIGCGKPGRPGVYTRISYYIPWIENIVWGNGR